MEEDTLDWSGLESQLEPEGMSGLEDGSCSSHRDEGSDGIVGDDVAYRTVPRSPRSDFFGESPLCPLIHPEVMFLFSREHGRP